jgi:hypothetical protein
VRNKVIGVVVSFMFLVLCVPSFAHAPSDMSLDYDAESDEIMVMVSHSSGNPSAHYVDRLEIAVNGDLMINEMPESQNNPALVVSTEDWGLKSGDVVSARAFCNRGGDITREMIVE